MDQQRDLRTYLRLYGLVYAPIALLFIGVLLLVFWMGRPDLAAEQKKIEQQLAAQERERPLTKSSTTTTITLEEEKDATTTIVVFGDSITAGYGLELSEAYPSVLERDLREAGYHVVVINAGVSGETTAGGIRRADFVAKQHPDVVIVALGGNDMLRGIDPAATRNNLAGIIETFQHNGAKVVLAGMQAPSNLGPAYVEQFNAIYPQLGKEFSVTLIPFLLEGVALDPDKNQSDGIHPNAEGAQIVARDNVLPHILPLLKHL